MAKAVQTKQTRTDQGPKSTAPLAKQAHGILKTILDGLSGHAEEAVEMLVAKGCDSERASDLATLGQKVSQIMDAIRKLETSDTKAASHLTKSVVLAYLRQLEASERAGLLREARRIDEEGSVLA